jgi:hypothetical protein
MEEPGITYLAYLLGYRLDGPQFESGGVKYYSLLKFSRPVLALNPASYSVGTGILFRV